MPVRVNRKNDKQVKALSNKLGTHAVGGVDGLSLRVRALKNGDLSRIWILRVYDGKKERKKSLGAYPLVSLAEARRLAEGWIKKIIEGGDPFLDDEQERIRKKEEQERAKIEAITLDDVLSDYFEYKAGRDWKRPEKTKEKEENRLRSHFYALLPLKLSEITPEEIKQALSPIWINNPTVADRVLGHLKGLFEWAMKVKHFLPNGANPADGRFISLLLPPKSKRKQETNMSALEPDQLPSFMKALHERAVTHQSAKCLEFAILTCVRSGNVRFMKWEQLNEDLTIWEIDADDMKVTANGQHVIPLSKQATEILKQQKALAYSQYVFPSERLADRPLSNSTLNMVIKDLHTLEIKAGREGWIDRKKTKQQKKPCIAVQHGISRATFKTWSESTRQDVKATELILHHDVGGRLKSAYDRDESMKYKKEVLQNWADFCYSLINK